MSSTVVCNRYLAPDGVYRVEAQHSGGGWVKFSVLRPAEEPVTAEYLVKGSPVDLHCHGVGGLDFSTMSNTDLVEVDAILQGRGTLCVPTIYLERDRLGWLVELVNEYSVRRARGELRNILGFSTEGPLLGSVGGIPQKGSWVPTKSEWERLAGLAEHGFLYTVISPDAMNFGLLQPRERATDVPDMRWVFELLARSGVKPRAIASNSVTT